MKSKNDTAPKSAVTSSAKGKAAKNTAKQSTAEVKASATAATVTPAKSKVPKLVNTQGTLLTTQECANLLGKCWQHLNKKRSAGLFIDTAAVLKASGAFLYKRSDLNRWARENGYQIAA